MEEKKVASLFHTLSQLRQLKTDSGFQIIPICPEPNANTCVFVKSVSNWRFEEILVRDVGKKEVIK